LSSNARIANRAHGIGAAGRRQAGVLPLGVIAAFQLLAEFLGVVAPLRQPDQVSQHRASVAVAALFGGVI
jgi:hypothetical protein